MPKKRIPVPSDFSKPKPGVYQKPKAVIGENTKGEFTKKKSSTPKSKTNFEDKPLSIAPVKKQRKSKRAFLAEEEKANSKNKFQNKNSKEENLNLNSKFQKPNSKEETQKSKNQNKHQTSNSENLSSAEMPLNKYIAHCGICSRRDAVDLIKKGKIKVNSLVETEPGKKVSEKDYVIFEDKRIFPQRNLAYYLLNKPKNFITTTDDPEGRKTVMDLLGTIPEKNVYPVGRLDRNTTGLLLLTNDGDLAQKLTHPKYNVKKIYQVVLDKPLTKIDFEKILNGVVLEDGLAPVDELAYINLKDKREIGIQIHVGRNRIVRRIFESLQYEVKALDRVLYAGLTKKNLQRGHWRQLTEKEIIFLKHFKS